MEAHWSSEGRGNSFRGFGTQHWMMRCRMAGLHHRGPVSQGWYKVLTGIVAHLGKKA